MIYFQSDVLLEYPILLFGRIESTVFKPKFSFDVSEIADTSFKMSNNGIFQGGVRK